MKADLTRNSFDPLKHFSGVLMQQGRVQLDADWNEQSSILLHLIRQLVVDFGGSAVSPKGGFRIDPLTTATVVDNDVLIAPGSYYVDGILCELESTPMPILSWDAKDGHNIKVANWTVDGGGYQVGQYVEVYDDSAKPVAAAVLCKVAKLDYSNLTLTLDTDVSSLRNAANGRLRRLTTYLTQPDLPNPAPLSSGKPRYQLYLDVWERAITYVEDDSIREVALNGPDTAARSRVVWQVKALPATLEGCVAQGSLADQLQPWNRGLLRARAEPAQVSTDPCTISPDSLYRGPENQLYRVEIHTGSNDPSGLPPSFKWSRENGAVVFPIVKLSSGDTATTVTLGNLGRDDRFSLEPGDYVEVQDDNSVLSGSAGKLLQVQAVDSNNCIVTLAGNVAAGVGNDPTLHPLLRRWDHKAGDAAQGGLTLGKDGAALISTASSSAGKFVIQIANPWLDLEDGVQIQFEELSYASYRSGDYWLIPARVATGDVIWPQESYTDANGKTSSNPVAKGPDGITHHYAPLAVVTVKAGAAPQVTQCGVARAVANPVGVIDTPVLVNNPGNLAVNKP
ncbi:MAG: DUF6519 domain-containing protein [Nevskia sp.]|nr:DUF6519 domain-containing protein [Nevskia sp.]